jgi:hypothetical protein
VIFRKRLGQVHAAIVKGAGRFRGVALGLGQTASVPMGALLDDVVPLAPLGQGTGMLDGAFHPVLWTNAVAGLIFFEHLLLGILHHGKRLARSEIANDSIGPYSVGNQRPVAVVAILGHVDGRQQDALACLSDRHNGGDGIVILVTLLDNGKELLEPLDAFFLLLVNVFRLEFVFAEFPGVGKTVGDRFLAKRDMDHFDRSPVDNLNNEGIDSNLRQIHWHASLLILRTANEELLIAV